MATINDPKAKKRSKGLFEMFMDEMTEVILPIPDSMYNWKKKPEKPAKKKSSSWW